MHIHMLVDNQSTTVEWKHHLVTEDFIFSSVCFAFLRTCELSIEMVILRLEY